MLKQLLGFTAIAVLVGACAGTPEHSSYASSKQPTTSHGPVHHPEHHVIARYGDRRFRVNTKFVSMLSKSVIAVRESAPDGSDESWPEAQIEPRHMMPNQAPFAEDRYRVVAIDIAEQLTSLAPLCGETGQMALMRNGDGEISTMYHSERRAWVVFAACA